MRSDRIIVFLLLVAAFAFILLGGRCFYLQHFKSPHYYSVSLTQQQKRVPERPQRGPILDCRGRVLAASNRVQTVFAEPRVIENCQAVSARLAPILDMSAQDIESLITGSGNPGFVKLKVEVDADRCQAVARTYGIGVQSDWQRHYPVKPLACHVIGFTSADNRGLAGVELYYDKELCGSTGQDIFFADVQRRPIRLKEEGAAFKDGVGIILTIDATIQQFARAALLEQYKSYQAESASAIVAEPKTGAILAMVSLPDFDPNKFSTTDANNLRNRCLTDQFEPGSMIKPVVMAIALDAGVVGQNEIIYCEDGYYYGRGFGRIREHRYHKYGNLTVREILVKSSNIGMAKVGQRLGKDRLYKGLRLFGFGQETGIDLPGEVAGQLAPAGTWTGYSVTRIPFGQEICTTGIQAVRAFCMLANGGRAVRPFVVKALVDSNGTIIKLKRPSPPVAFVVKPEVAKWVVEDAMAGVVNEGTGRLSKLEKWQVFGKTGTANIANANAPGYSDTDYIASFIAGAPAEDPKILVLVSVRKPNKKLGKGYEGGRVAAPVVRTIIEKTLTYLENTASSGSRPAEYSTADRSTPKAY